MASDNSDSSSPTTTRNKYTEQNHKYNTTTFNLPWKSVTCHPKIDCSLRLTAPRVYVEHYDLPHKGMLNIMIYSPSPPPQSACKTLWFTSSTRVLWTNIMIYFLHKYMNKHYAYLLPTYELTRRTLGLCADGPPNMKVRLLVARELKLTDFPQKLQLTNTCGLTHGGPRDIRSHFCRYTSNSALKHSKSIYIANHLYDQIISKTCQNQPWNITKSAMKDNKFSQETYKKSAMKHSKFIIPNSALKHSKSIKYSQSSLCSNHL